MGQVITNLKARFGLETGDFKKGAAEAQDSLLQLDRQVQKGINSISGMLSPMALLAGAGGALYALKDSIQAVEGPGDKFEATIKGGQEALFEMQRALATMDFSNLISNIAEAYGKGKEFAELLDELQDKKAYSDYVIVGLEQEAEALREISKNKTLEISERAKAADQIKKIEEQILARRKEILQQSFDIEKQQWELRNKMTVEEGVKLFEAINKIQKSGYNGVSAENAAFIKQVYDNIFQGQRIMGTSVAKSAKYASDLMKANLMGYGEQDIIKNIPKADLEYLADVFGRINMANTQSESDVWVKLFDTINKNAIAVNEAQQNYNAAIKETTTLLAQEERTTAKAAANTTAQVKAVKELQALNAAKALNNASPISAIPTQDINAAIIMPDFFDAEDKLAGFSQTVKDTSIDISNTLNQSLFDMAVGIGEFTGALANGNANAADFGKMIAATFADMAINVGKIAIQTGIATAAIKLSLNSLQPAAAIAAGIALVALGSTVKGALASASSGGGGGGSSSVASSSGSVTYGKATSTEVQQKEIAVFNTDALKAVGESIQTGFTPVIAELAGIKDAITVGLELVAGQIKMIVQPVTVTPESNPVNVNAPEVNVPDFMVFALPIISELQSIRFLMQESMKQAAISVMPVSYQAISPAQQQIFTNPVQRININLSGKIPLEATPQGLTAVLDLEKLRKELTT